MKEMTMDEMKKSALEVLIEIDGICCENGINYSLAYGTLLGAVRHKGFIPWDDDIDIMMPRSDYLKFVDYCKNNTTKFKLAANETDSEYGYIFAKACDPDTAVVYENSKWNKYGVQVDIFPIEDLGATKEKAQENFKKRRFQRELLVAWNWKKFEWNKKRNLKINLIRFCFYIMSRFASNKKLIASIKKYYENPELKNSEYVGIICGAYRTREIMHKSVYEGYTDIMFESKAFKAIKNYDEYLSIVYGDYIKLPPVEMRVTHHDFKAYRK